MSIRNPLLMAGMLFLANPSASAESSSTYVCVPKHSIGYGIGSSGSWEPMEFTVSGKSYLLSEKDGKWKWKWKEFGKDNEIVNALMEKALGKQECTSVNENGFVRCSDSAETMTFNRETLRFMVNSPKGYVTSRAGIAKEPKEYISPFFEIGVCSKAP